MEEKPILFYPPEFYTFDNFSSFAIEWKGRVWMTSEHVYHSEKFDDPTMRDEIFNMRSAHAAFKYGQSNKSKRKQNWDEIKVHVMREILRAKINQHPYVKKKLLESGDREIIEDSWRDDFWGWGPNKDGKNQLGKLWMELREEIKRGKL